MLKDEPHPQNAISSREILIFLNYKLIQVVVELAF